jgi:hypothetical protein
MKPTDRKAGVAGRKRKAARLEKDGKRDCQKADPPDDRRAEKNGQRSDGIERATRTGLCQKKRSYHKGGSIGKRDPLR